MIRNKIYLFPLVALGITTISGIIASTSTTSAEDITPIDDEVTITVDSACTMGQTTLSTNPTLNPGETGTIGTSRIAAYCNDANGYDVYAIGYTNGEYGNTNMTNTTGNTIPTGLSGTGSYWNMQLTPGASTATPSYIPTITNNFTTPSTIPNDFTKVATYPSTTIPQSEDPLSSGSYFTTTYASHISTTQPAGVYTGQVQYVMVHPQGAPAPTFMQDTAKIKTLLTNYGDTMQAIDKRDGKKYWITKLADGNIWMTQNLDLDIVAGKTYTSADTDLPSDISWTPTSSEATYTQDNTTWNWFDTTPESYNPGNFYWNSVIGYGGTISSRTVTDPSATSGGTHYHIGNYYNWTAAVAMSDSSTYTTEYQDVNQSICPAGWRLPTYSDDKSYQNLINAQSLTAGTDGNIQNNPVYLAYSGYWYGYSFGVGGDGGYWFGVVDHNSSSYKLGFSFNGFLNPQNRNGRSEGFSLRCVAR